MGIAKCQLLSNAHLHVVLEANDYAKFSAFCRKISISYSDQHLCSSRQLPYQHLKPFKLDPVASGRQFQNNVNKDIRQPIMCFGVTTARDKKQRRKHDLLQKIF